MAGRSTGKLSRSSMTGGGSVTLTIKAENSGFTHKYKLSFGTGMETSTTDVAAGVETVSISIPENWSSQIPNAEQKTGGTLTLDTYNGSTLIGTYTISGLTYKVPESAVPEIGTISKAVARTIGETTYANVGDYYVQNHSGVTAGAAATGALGSTISSMKIEIAGYSGEDYNKTVSSGSISLTSGLLTISGETVITVTATDSRGRKEIKQTTITVTPYVTPNGTLEVYRVDENEDPDKLGTYGWYVITANYTEVGSNSLTKTLTSQGDSAEPEDDSGTLLPDDEQTFDIDQEYAVSLTLQDAFETVTINDVIPKAKFIIYVNAAGDQIGFMKEPDQSIPEGKDGTIEFSADHQIYIGNETLEDYIRSIVNAM